MLTLVFALVKKPEQGQVPGSDSALIRMEWMSSLAGIARHCLQARAPIAVAIGGGVRGQERSDRRQAY